MIPLSDEGLTTFAMLTARLDPGQIVTYDLGDEWPLLVTRLDVSRCALKQRDPDSGLTDTEVIFLCVESKWYAVTWISQEWDADEEAVEFDEYGEIINVDERLQASHAEYAEIWLRQIATAFEMLTQPV